MANSKETFFGRHNNLNINRIELERKYKAYLREHEEMERLQYLSVSTFNVGTLRGEPFISTWRTTSSNESITLPYSSTGQYSGVIYWGDGTTSLNTYNNRTHVYVEPGDYVITISGYMRGWAFNNLGDRLKIISIQQWGCFNHGNLSGAFNGCSNLTLTSVSDTYKLSSNTTLGFFFANCTSITTINNLNDWDISNITSLQRMFNYCSNFNQDLDKWNTSKVTTINNTFSFCTLFNGNITTWDTSSITGITSAFTSCINFNQNIGSWNVSSMNGMENAFNGCISFNQNLNNWNTSKLTNMRNCFIGCVSYNQPMNNWDVSKVITFENAFRGCTSFNQNIGSWNVSSATSMTLMFNGCTSFNQNIGNWNVSNVINMAQMFEGASAFNQDLSNWNVSKVTSMYRILSNATAFNQNLGSWIVSNVTNFIDFMFGKTPATFSTANLDAIYNGWTNRILQATRTITFGTAKRTAASTEARALLTRTNRTVLITNVVNNGSGVIRITANSHGLVSGNKIFISGVLGATEANGAWNITFVNSNTFDLNGSTFSNSYISGGTLRTGYGWTVTDGGI